jgi:hypothetical protein
MLASIGVDVPRTRSFTREEHLIARRDDEQRRRIRFDSARSETAAATLRDDIRLAGFVRPIVGIDIVRIALWLDLRRPLRGQDRATEGGRQAAKAVRSGRIEADPSALERSRAVCRSPLRAQR